MKTDTVVLPAYWASALINRDYTAYSEQDRKEINEWIAENPQFGSALSCGEHTLMEQLDGLLTECLEFTFPLREETARIVTDERAHQDAVDPARPSASID